MIVLRPDEECRIGLAWWRFENVLASLVEQSRAGGRAGGRNNLLDSRAN